jgi:5-methyltetrahydrofolate--homocysteine methyltransferase
MMESYESLQQAVEIGNSDRAVELVEEYLDKGGEPRNIIEKAVVPALDRVGKKFSSGECFIPEMLVAARASQIALDLLMPRLVSESVIRKGKLVLGTVKGDLHDIGKNIVALVFKSTGFEVIDLGVDVSPQQFLDAIGQFKPDIVGMSCLLTTTMIALEETVRKIRFKGVGDELKIFIGGPPTSAEFCERIGADHYCKDAYVGVSIAKELVS